MGCLSPSQGYPPALDLLVIPILLIITWVGRLGESVRVKCLVQEQSTQWLSQGFTPDHLHHHQFELLININYYMARWSWGKSVHSDWFFLGRDFAIRTITMEMVISSDIFFCFRKLANSSFATKTTARKHVNALIFAKKLPKRLIFYKAYNKNEEDEYSRSEFCYRDWWSGNV